ncbi:MAG: OsmC family protein [Saprospirales bacterium]|nr:OsmC family protein [Saprospirales bacterium]MBK8490202.1 OsmC family protein [Saprospirales bacterium]
MEITIQRLTEEEPFHLRATNDLGNTVDIDGSPEIGGNNQGMRPMQLLLTSMGTCSAMDIIHLLRKQRQGLRDLKVSVKGDRVDTHPRIFERVHLHFDLYGALDAPKVERAVSLSVEKYCTAIKMVEKVATVTYDYTIHP